MKNLDEVKQMPTSCLIELDGCQLETSAAYCHCLVLIHVKLKYVLPKYAEAHFDMT